MFAYVGYLLNSTISHTHKHLLEMEFSTAWKKFSCKTRQEIEKTPCRNVLIKWNDHIFAVCQSASLHSLLIPLPIYFLQFKISANSRGGNLPEQYLQDERKPFGTKCNLRMSKSLWMRCQRNGKRANITIVVFEFFFRENVIVSFSFNANDGVWDGYMYLAGAEKG